jgi:transposase
LSGFKDKAQQKILHEHDLLEKSINTGKEFMVAVPILKQEHIGEHMAIDEKHINDVFYTILSNGSTGKVAMMVASVNPEKIGKCLDKFGDKLKNVKVLTRDMSPTYQYIGTHFFQNAQQVADKYHVIAHGLDVLQAIRIRYRQAALKNEREQQAAHKKQQKVQKENAKLKDQIYQSIAYSPVRLNNGETHVELLARSKYLLYKKSSKWNENQRERSIILFKQFPEIQIAHQQIEAFRKWYEPKEFQQREDKNWTIDKAENGLLDWIYKTEDCKIEELQNFRNTVENNELYLLNYHLENKTNAIAESINSKIMNAIRQNKGTRDLDFFHFRLNMIL